MKAFFAGSFNPFTIGHDAIVRRGLNIFDSIVIGVGINCNKGDCADAQQRADVIRSLYVSLPQVSVVVYDGLTVDAARQYGCGVLLRGVRTVKDFEYERDLADVNRQISGIETVILTAEPKLAAISSSVVRELLRYGRDVSQFLP